MPNTEVNSKSKVKIHGKKVKVQTGNIGYLQEHDSARKWKQKAHKLKYIYTTQEDVSKVETTKWCVRVPQIQIVGWLVTHLRSLGQETILRLCEQSIEHKMMSQSSTDFE